MQAKVILFDVDGTLFDNATHKVAPSTLAALRKLKAAGHLLGLATGRAAFMLEPVAAVLPFCDCFVLLNGAHVTAFGELIFSSTMAKAEVERLTARFRALKVPYGLQNAGREVLSEPAPAALAMLKAHGLAAPPIASDLPLAEGVYQLWIYATPEQAALLATEFPEYAFPAWGAGGYDVIRKGVDKGLGITKLAAALGRPLADFIVFGDGDNDLEMAEAAGYAVAMGNATERLKAVSDLVTTSVAEDGIAEALRRLKLI